MKKKGPVYDITLKEILKRPDTKLISILTGREDIGEFLNTEFPATKNRIVDLLLKYKDNKIYHIELQTKNEKNFEWRMSEYYMLIYKEYNIPPEQIVIYTGEEPLKIEKKINHNNFNFQYRIIDLSKDINCDELLNSDKPEDWIMAPLCNFENEAIILTEVVKRLNSLPNREREDSLIKLTTLLGLRKKLEQRILKEVDEMPIKVLEHPLFKEGEKKGVARGIKKGIEKGIERKTKEDVINLYKETNWGAKKISKILKIPSDKVTNILKEEGLI
jgi:predicted transposase YdaD